MELVTRGFEHAARGFELVTRVLLFHYLKSGVSKSIVRVINDPTLSSIVVEVIRTVLFCIKIFYTKIKHPSISTRLKSIIKYTS